MFKVTKLSEVGDFVYGHWSRVLDLLRSFCLGVSRYVVIMFFFWSSLLTNELSCCKDIFADFASLFGEKYSYFLEDFLLR